MKARGVILIDFEFDNLKEAAAAQERLERAMEDLVRGDRHVVYYQSDMKERRGDNRPDLRQMKFRTS